MTKVTWRNAANAVTKTVEYRYDGLGRRIEKSVDDNGNGTVDRREQYIYEGAGLLTASGGSVSISGPNGELNQHGWVDDVVLVLDGAGTIQHRYLHGPLIDQVFADETAGGEVLWALADHLGTVRDWARARRLRQQRNPGDSGCQSRKIQCLRGSGLTDRRHCTAAAQLHRPVVGRRR